MTSTAHLAQELLMGRECTGGSRNFAKETRALKMSMVASHWELTTTNWEQLSKLILLQIHKKLPKILTLTILWSFSVWSKLDSWKSSVSGCLMNWLLIKKKIYYFEVSSSFILYNNNKPFINWIVKWHKKWILYKNCWWPVVGLKRGSKALPKAKLAGEKCHGHCVIVCCWSDPL